MLDNANAKHLPAIFKILVEKKGRLLDDKDVRMWIKDRIVPPERQNIGEILRNIGIENYDEFEILRFCKGRSCMDEFEIEECEMEEGLFIAAN